VWSLLTVITLEILEKEQEIQETSNYLTNELETLLLS